MRPAGKVHRPLGPARAGPQLLHMRGAVDAVAESLVQDLVVAGGHLMLRKGHAAGRHHSGFIPAVIPAERANSIVIPGERSETRDPRCSDAGGRWIPDSRCAASGMTQAVIFPDPPNYATFARICDIMWEIRGQILHENQACRLRHRRSAAADARPAHHRQTRQGSDGPRLGLARRGVSEDQHRGADAAARGRERRRRLRHRSDAGLGYVRGRGDAHDLRSAGRPRAAG